MPRDDPVRTWGGVGRPHTQERGLGRNHPADTWNLASELNPLCPVHGTWSPGPSSPGTLTLLLAGSLVSMLPASPVSH